MIVYPNAKINIGLSVTSLREDGFHNLETIFYPIALSDILEVNRADEAKGVCMFESTGLPLDCAPEKNLVVKAYKLLAFAYQLPAIEVKLHKVIPFGAGLGGGSSDAAFMLQLLNEYFDLKITENGLRNYAARLGSDCAFFIKNKPVFAYGKGELLEEIGLSLGNYRIIVVKPGCEVSTAEAYAGIEPQSAAFDLRQLVNLPVEKWKNKVVNDFEKTIFPKYPQIQRIKDTMYRYGAVYASMTGSGSAVFGLFKKGEGDALEFEGDFVWKQEVVTKE